jgi:hypothetical protein
MKEIDKFYVRIIEAVTKRQMQVKQQYDAVWSAEMKRFELAIA